MAQTDLYADLITLTFDLLSKFKACGISFHQVWRLYAVRSWVTHQSIIPPMGQMYDYNKVESFPIQLNNVAFCYEQEAVYSQR